MDLLVSGDGIARSGDPDRLASQPLTVREDAVDHIQLGHGRQDRRPFRAGLARDEIHGMLRCGPGGRRVAGGATDMGEPVVEEPDADAVSAGVQGTDRRLEVGRRSRRAPDREGRDRRTFLEIGPVGGADGGRALRAALRPVESFDTVAQAQGKLERLQLVGRGVPLGGQIGGGDGRLTCGGSVVGLEPVVGGRRREIAESRGQRGVVPSQRQGEQVALDGRSDELVSEADRIIALDQETVLDALGESRGKVGVEDPVAAPEHVGGARGRAVRLDLEVGGDRGQLLGIERAPGRRDEAQHSPAFHRTNGEAAHHELVQRAGERRGGQLAAGGQEFLGDERAAAGPLGHEQEQAGRRSFAFDALDEGRQFAPIQERQRQPLERPGCGRDGGDRAGPRVVAGHDVRLIRGDERQPLVRRDPCQEGHERPRRRIRAVQVLEHEDDRASLTEPPQHPEDALQGACLASFGCARMLGERRAAGRAKAGRDARQDAREIGRGRAQDGVQLVVGQGLERRPDPPGPPDRRARRCRPASLRPARPASARRARRSARSPRRRSD